MSDRGALSFHVDNRHVTLLFSTKTTSSQKLDWMNGYYIRELSAEELGSELLGFWTQFPPNEFDIIPTLENAIEVARLVRERLKTLSDAAPLVSFIFKVLSQKIHNFQIFSPKIL